MTRNHRAGWMPMQDGAVARVIRLEMGWITRSTTGVVTWDHLLDEATRRYWDVRAASKAA